MNEINWFLLFCKRRLYYPVAILKQLRTIFPTKRIGVLYDIGCHLGAHIAKVSSYLILDCVFNLN